MSKEQANTRTTETYKQPNDANNLKCDQQKIQTTKIQSIDTYKQLTKHTFN